MKVYIGQIFFLMSVPLVLFTQTRVPDTLTHFCAQYRVSYCSESSSLVNLNALDENGNSLLHLAVKSKDIEFVKYILNQNIVLLNRVNNSGDTPLHIASKQGMLEIVQQLISKNAQINVQNKQGDTPLLLAFYHKSFKVISFLLSQREVDINLSNFTGLTPLHIISYMGLNFYLSSIFNHFNQKINKNATDQDGLSALHYAAGNGHFQVVEFLVKHKINLNLQDHIGHTPLYNAVLQGHQKIVTYLLHQGALSNIVGLDGRNILHAAVLSGNNGLIKSLLSYHHLVNQKDAHGKTPLALAQERLDDSMVKILASHTNFNILNKKKQTPLMQLLELNRKNLYDAYFSLPHNYTQVDKDRNNLLHYFAKYKVSLFVLDKTILKKYVFFSVNIHKQTPWDLALQYNNLFMIQYYLKNFSKEILSRINLKSVIFSLRQGKKYILAKRLQSFLNIHPQKKHSKKIKKKVRKYPKKKQKKSRKTILERR